MVAHKFLTEKIPQLSVDQFVQEVTGSKDEDVPGETNSKLGAEILNEANKITVIRHIRIKKTKLISTLESRAIEEAKPVEAPSGLNNIAF